MRLTRNTYNRGLTLLVALLAVLGASIPPGPQAAAHEAPADVRLGVTTEKALGGDQADTFSGEENEYRLTFQLAEAHHSCGYNRTTRRHVDSSFRVLDEHVIRFNSRPHTWHYVDYPLHAALNSSHLLCVMAWGKELDDWSPDDPLPLITDQFSEADDWGAGEQELYGLGARPGYTIYYTIRVISRPPSETASESPSIEPAGPVAAPVPVIRLPDLRIVSIEVSKREDGSRPCDGNDRNYIDVTVRNDGDVPAGPFVVRVQAEGDSQEASVPGLAADTQTEVQVRMWLADGVRAVRAFVDVYNNVAESNEGNNAAMTTARCA